MHIVDVIEILPPFSRLDDRLLGSDETKNKVFTFARSPHSFLESMKHDFCLAGLLTYLSLLCLPTLIDRQWLEI